MHGYKISEAARATGFSESALRFYEQEGLVVLDRTDTGYRTYRAADVEALRFVARAKRLGLSLTEITELLALFHDDECRPMQTRMRQLITERIGTAQQQIADLAAFAAQLQETASRLAVHTPDGACDDECGCRSDPPRVDGVPWEAVPLAGSDSSGVACSLDADQVGARIDDWQAVVARADRRRALPNGVRLSFPRGTDVAAISDLAAAEQTCCSFFSFSVGIDAHGITLEVTGPPEAQPLISAMFGSAA